MNIIKQLINKRVDSMLVITRKPNERLHIKDEIQIKVIKVDGSKVSLGIIAPKEVTIVRSEENKEKPDEYKNNIK
jgi:carbon storage regulator